MWQCDFPQTLEIGILSNAIELQNDYNIDMLVCINMFVQKTYCRIVQKTYLMHIVYLMHCTDI
jgi:hypothetical protein